MSSPSSCTRCSRPLLVESATGLCPECIRTVNAPESTPRDLFLPVPDAHLFVSTLDASAARQSEVAQLTRTHHPTLEPATATVTGGKTLPVRVPLPAAPAGYEMIGELGIGGMGSVYLVHEVVPDRMVAMKFLRHAGSQTAFDRFLIEVRALAALDHPHIIRVLSSDFLRSDPYFTTEYLPAGSLLQKLEQSGPFSPGEAARVMAIAARAVHAANEHDVIHRDLKPSNILLTDDGAPKVADFGLAKRLDQDDGLTTTPGALGSPPYMAPEQTGKVNAGELDARTDVYGLGATLYHLVTGKRPFQGDTSDEVIKQVLNHHPTPPRSVRSEVPRELEAIILKCMEKERSRRYASAEALAADLDRFLAGQTPEAPLLTWPRRVVQRLRRNRKELAWLAGALVLVGVGLFLALRPRTAVSPPDAETAFLEKARKDLANGKAVTLISESGSPVYHRWKVETGEIKPIAEGNRTFAFLARGFGLIELFPDPGIDRYRISVELMHFQSAGAIPTPKVPALHKVGLYFGHEHSISPAGGRVHTFGAIDYSDFQQPKVTRPEVYYRDYAIDDRLLQFPINRGFMVGSARHDRVEALPGPWRKLEVEIAPGRIDAIYGERFAGRDAVGLHNRAVALGQWVNENAPGTTITDWSPRRPLGVWVFGSWVAVKNFTITPIPNP